MTLRSDLPLPILHTEKSRRTHRRIACAIAGVVALGAVGYALKGTGFASKFIGLVHPRHVAPPSPPAPAKVPAIVDNATDPSKNTIPADCTTGIDPLAPIIVKLDLPNGPLDPKTVTNDAVSLFRVDNRERVPANVVADGNSLRIVPVRPLEANRNYRLHVLPGLADMTGAKVRQNTRAFFTAAQPPAGVGFERVDAPMALGEGFTCLNFGPDGKLYASTHDGKLIRYAVAADGTLGKPEVLMSLLRFEGTPRLFTGFTFDPTSTAEAPVIYLTHSEFGFMKVTDFTGKISRLSGPNFEKFETLVTNLPRSARDHATNQPKFGPDGALYIPQPSNTAVGGPDSYWDMRQEHGLNATISASMSTR